MFVVCGLNHETASVEVREKIAPSATMQDTLLQRLMRLPTVNEAILLATCNRTEIYCDTDDPSLIAPWLVEEHHLPLEMLKHFYVHEGHEAVRHALRVASGLDSMILGEPQILGQIKQAYQQACELGSVKQDLQSIFPHVFGASKRIRTESGIGSHPVSIAFAATQLIAQRFIDFDALNVFLIGSGETASLVAKYLHEAGVQRFMVASRSQEHAQDLAASFAGQAFTISDIPMVLHQADIIITATACPLPFITPSWVEPALEKRAQQPMFFLDLAVPRNVENHIKDLPNVDLYNLDDLQTISQQGMAERRSAALEAEKLVEHELEQYIRQHRSLKAKEIICDYRQHMQVLAEQELQRARKKLAAGQCQYDVLEEFSERLMNKLMHTPSIGLQQAASDDRAELLSLLTQYLFNPSTPLSTV